MILFFISKGTAAGPPGLPGAVAAHYERFRGGPAEELRQPGCTL